MQIEINKDQLNDVQVMLKSLRLDGPKILTRTLNKTATKARTRSSQEIRKQVNLTNKYIVGSRGQRGKLWISRATFKKLQARVVAEKRGVLMTRYPHTMLARGGATVKIKRNGSRAKLPGAFKTTVPAGGNRVEVLAIREDGRTKTGKPKMKVLYSPSVSQVFNTVRDGIDDELMEFLALATDREIAAALRGY